MMAASRRLRDIKLYGCTQLQAAAVAGAVNDIETKTVIDIIMFGLKASTKRVRTICHSPLLFAKNMLVIIKTVRNTCLKNKTNC